MVNEDVKSSNTSFNKFSRRDKGGDLWDGTKRKQKKIFNTNNIKVTEQIKSSD